MSSVTFFFYPCDERSFNAFRNKKKPKSTRYVALWTCQRHVTSSYDTVYFYWQRNKILFCGWWTVHLTHELLANQIGRTSHRWVHVEPNVNDNSAEHSTWPETWEMRLECFRRQTLMIRFSLQWEM